MRPGRVMVVVGSIVAVVSLVGVAVGVWLAASPVVGGLGDTVRAPVLTTPARSTMTLDHAAYTVYEAVSGDGTLLSPADVVVVSAGGQPVRLTDRTGETLTRGGRTFRSVAGFVPPQAGRYEVTLNGPPGAEVVVAPSVLSSFRDAVPGVLVGALSGLTLLVGLVLLVVGLVRRSRARRRPPPGSWTPPTQLGQWPQQGPWQQSGAPPS